jgi:hemolysin activation/secretion protein
MTLMRHTVKLAALLAFVAMPVFAVTGVPGPAGLQRLQDMIGVDPMPLKDGELLSVSSPASTTILRDDIRFPLSSVEIRGVTQLPAKELKPIIANLTGQESSLAEIDGVVRQINALYQKHGLFLARAFLPAQQIAEGRVVIQVIEGRLDRVDVQGPGHLQERRLVKDLIGRLQHGPLTQDAVESALLRLNDLPGIAAHGTFVPGDVSGTTRLVLDLAERKVSGEADFNNYGTKYLGPNQIQGSVAFANPFTNGADQITLQGTQTTDMSSLSAGNVDWKMPLTPDLYIGANAQAAHSQPGWILADSGITGSNLGWGARAGYVPIERRNLRVEFGGGFEYLNADGAASDAPLSRDRTRVAQVYTNWQGRDEAFGRNNITLKIRRGLNIDGATGRGDLMASRPRGTGTDFTTFGYEASRLQTLNEYWGLLLASKGQFADHAVLAGEQFAFGGSQWGRGYPAQELLGDNGLAATAELQLTFNPEFRFLQTYQLIGFYDAGAVWNRNHAPGDPGNPLTRVSGGIGARTVFRPGLNGTFIVARPLSNTPNTSDRRSTSILFQLQKQFDVIADKDKAK